VTFCNDRDAQGSAARGLLPSPEMMLSIEGNLPPSALRLLPPSSSLSRSGVIGWPASRVARNPPSGRPQVGIALFKASMRLPTPHRRDEILPNDCRASAILRGVIDGALETLANQQAANRSVQPVPVENGRLQLPQ
jgi:hypothetical protein